MGACSSPLPKSVSDAPVLSVATGLWPLAQAASEVGGSKVVVVDVVPAGADPLTFDPDPAQARVLQGAGLVLEVGGGFQAGLERAAAGARAVTAVGTDLGASDPYVWLDPATMVRVVQDVSRAMTAANPAAGALYRRNAHTFESEIESIGQDYSSTLSTCPGTRIITPDRAFSAMAGAYGLSDRVVPAAPRPDVLAAAKSELETGSVVAVLSQPWVDNSGVEQVAAASKAPVHAVDTLAGTPTVTAAGQGTYFAQMEHLLGQISAALGCNPTEQ